MLNAQVLAPNLLGNEFDGGQFQELTAAELDAVSGGDIDWVWVGEKVVSTAVGFVLKKFFNWAYNVVKDWLDGGDPDGPVVSRNMTCWWQQC